MQQPPAPDSSSSTVSIDKKENPHADHGKALEITTPGGEKQKPQPPKLSDPSQEAPTSALVVVNSTSGIPPKRFGKLFEAPEFCITLPQHLQTQDKQHFFHGDAAYYFHILVSGKTEARLGLPLDDIENKLKALRSQYSTVLSAQGAKSDEFMDKIKELSTEISTKRQTIFTMSGTITQENALQNLEKYIVQSKQMHTYGKFDLEMTPAFETFWNEVTSFGNLPHILLCMRLIRQKQFGSFGSLFGSADISIELGKFHRSFELKPLLVKVLCRVKAVITDNKFEGYKAEIEKTMKAFIELHEYLYRQQIMKKIVALHNSIAVKVKAGFSAKSGYGVLKKNVLYILYEHSKVIPEFRMFITYQGFCKKMSYLINLIPDDEAQATKQDLIDCMKEVDKDVACKTIIQKYEKLVTRLYDALMAAYNQIQALDNEEFPNKWYNFKVFLVIINYLNSSENPFARQDPAKLPAYSEFHQEALTQFTIYQNDLTNNTQVVAHLTDESLQTFCTQEGSVLSARLSDMLQSGLDRDQIMSALSQKPTDSLLLLYLEGEPTPPVPKGAAAAAAKMGVHPAPKKPAANSSSTALVPATSSSPSGDQAANQGSDAPARRKDDCRIG